MEAKPRQASARTADTGRRSDLRGRLLPAAGVLVVAVVALLALAGPGSGPPSSSPVSLPGLGGQTAMEALDSALEAAERWEADAQLAGASCTWSEAGVASSSETEWAFQFYSPSTQRLAVVMVSGDAAWLFRDVLSPYVVPTFSTAEWRVDSDEALQVWWDYVGRSLLGRHPTADVAVQLRPSADHEMRLVWSVVGLFGDPDDALAVTVSGVEGTIVQ
jgi:hypothetical protein